MCSAHDRVHLGSLQVYKGHTNIFWSYPSTICRSYGAGGVNRERRDELLLREGGIAELQYINDAGLWFGKL